MTIVEEREWTIHCDGPGCKYFEKVVQHDKPSLPDKWLDIGGRWYCPRCAALIRIGMEQKAKTSHAMGPH